MHELTKTYEIDDRWYVIKSVGMNPDNMTAKEIVNKSLANFSTKKKANDWSKKRSDNYKPKKQKKGFLEKQGLYKEE